MRLPPPLIAAVGSLAVALGIAVIPIAITDPSAVQAQEDMMGMAPEIAVQAGEMFFEPNTFVVVAGETVYFHLENVGQFNHVWVADVDGEEYRSPSIRPGEPLVWEVVFTAPGTYHVFCDRSAGQGMTHADLGMVGTLEVLPAA